VECNNTEFCGDPATERCPRKHREWTIIRPFELKKGDVLLRPDGRIYAVVKVRHKTDERFSDPDVFVVETGQQERFVILYAKLPILVKREVVCDWPTCGLHCAKCMRLGEAEERREHLLALEKPEKRRKHQRLPELDGSIRPKKIKKPGKRRSPKCKPKTVADGLTPNVCNSDEPPC